MTYNVFGETLNIAQLNSCLVRLTGFLLKSISLSLNVLYSAIVISLCLLLVTWFYSFL